MIVKMQHLVLACVAAETEKTLETLRTLGIVHITPAQSISTETQNAKAVLSKAELAVRLIKKEKGTSKNGRGYLTVNDVIAADDERKDLIVAADELRRTIALYEPFGDFDPVLAMRLREQGLTIELAKTPVQAPVPEVTDGYAQLLSTNKFNKFYAIIGKGAKSKCELVTLPAERLSVTRTRLAEVETKIAAISANLAASSELVNSLSTTQKDLIDDIAFCTARDALAQHGPIAILEGWVPVDAVSALRAKAAGAEWGLIIRDATDNEVPPTLLRPPKLFQPIVELFAALGIAPAYTESDVSIPFFCYFSIFFAMLIGDGGYGSIILLTTLWGWFKLPKTQMVRAWLTLVTVFALATITWGVLSNTWFGAAIPALNTLPSVAWLGDPTYNNMMFLCFTIGVSHLMLARVWNGICRWGDRTCVAEFGWAGVVFFMYWVTNSIVGIFSGGIPNWLYGIFGASLFCIFFFTVRASELKTRGIELGMLPLNIMGTLGDIISYVRLFAVGLASVKVAQNFNEMAVGLNMPLWLKVVPMVLILVVGHTINFAMAGLSILVHAVRLNTLEFSNHKGISWTGFAFKPFKKH